MKYLAAVRNLKAAGLILIDPTGNRRVGWTRVRMPFLFYTRSFLVVFSCTAMYARVLFVFVYATGRCDFDATGTALYPVSQLPANANAGEY